MKRDLQRLGVATRKLENEIKSVSLPVLRFEAPSSDAEASELFARAREGDTEANQRLGALIRDRGWVTWLGSLGSEATRCLIRRATGGDPVWEAGVAAKVSDLQASLLSDTPTALELLLVGRVVNGWIAIHALELELAVCPPTDPSACAHFDKALSRAQRRFTDAIRELARVRNLKLPTVLSELTSPASSGLVKTTLGNLSPSSGSKPSSSGTRRR